MKGDIVMSKEKLDELIAATKLGELISKKEDEDKKCCKKCSTIIIAVLAIVGAVAAVAGIAYAVYRYFTPDYLDDFDDEDFEDEDFDDDFTDQYVPTEKAILFKYEKKFDEQLVNRQYEARVENDRIAKELRDKVMSELKSIIRDNPTPVSYTHLTLPTIA